MGLGFPPGQKGGLIYLPFVCFLASLILDIASANVLLIGKNASFSFDDLEASFTPAVTGSGERGLLYLAEPLNACTTLMNGNSSLEAKQNPFALIVRGGCSFEDKVRNAQRSGFRAAIVYDNEDTGVLVAMAGNSAGIKIHAIFISKASGEELMKYAGMIDFELWIIPTFENSAWSIMVISFVSMLAISAVIATCFFVRRHRIRRDLRSQNVHQSHGMSSRLVKALPSIVFTMAVEDNCTSCTCAICLEDYSPGEKLRVLPCHHKFHAICVDSWLTIWRTFCPVCKRDARINLTIPPASECTPLLSPQLSAASLSASYVLSSSRSLSTASQVIQISQASFGYEASLHRQSLASTPNTPHSLGSYRNSPVNRSLASTPNIPRSYRNAPGIHLSRSSAELQNIVAQRSRAVRHASPHSFGQPYLFSPAGLAYDSTYLPSSSNPSSFYQASPLYVGSSSRPPCLLHHSESTTSISPTASAQSLPGC